MVYVQSMSSFALRIIAVLAMILYTGVGDGKRQSSCHMSHHIESPKQDFYQWAGKQCI